MSADRLRVAVLISGSGTNLQAIIDAQLDIELVSVLSDRPDAYGLTRARDAGIPAQAIDFAAFAERADYDAALADALTELRPDLVVLAGYMRILPDATVNAWAGRMLNIHPSLLPAYPGLNTYARAIAAGETHHGTTVHYVIPELDAGPPILQYRVEIQPDDTADALQARVQLGEYLIYPRVIGWIAADRLRFGAAGPELDGKQLTAPVVIDGDD